MTPVKCFFTACLVLMVTFESISQGIPLFNQKITSSLLLNPALTASNGGTMSYSYRKSFNQIKGAPVSNLLDFQIPFYRRRFGTGMMICDDQANFIRNTIIAASFAHHIKLNKTASLSLGLSGEYDRLSIVHDVNFFNPDANPVFDALQQQAANRFDFSFGVHLNTQIFQAGISLNRLTSIFFISDNSRLLTPFYSLYVQNLIWKRGKDRFETFVAIRSLTGNTYSLLDLALYYTIKERIMLGMSYKTVGAWGLHVAFNINPKLLVAHTSEQYANGVGNALGTTREFNLKYGFEQAIKERFICHGVEQKRKKKPKSLDINFLNKNPRSKVARVQSGKSSRVFITKSVKAKRKKISKKK
jgi:type IX secretion system PorP/SprF family membrane protein